MREPSSGKQSAGLSCRSTTSSSAPSRASGSRGPDRRRARGTLYVARGLRAGRGTTGVAGRGEGTAGREPGHQRQPGALRLVGQAGRARRRWGVRTGARIGQLRSQHRTDPADQTGREQGVSAQVEEVVVDTDRVEAQDLGEQPARISSRGVRGVRSTGAARRSRVRAAPCGPACRSASAAVRAAPRGRGHHILRQLSGGEVRTAPSSGVLRSRGLAVTT